MNFRKQVSSIVLICICALAASGCSQPDIARDTAAIRTPAIPFTIVSSGDSTAELATASTCAWLPDMHEVHGSPRIGDVPVADMLDDAITDILAKKGYRFTPSSAGSDLHIGYVVALGDTASATRAEDRYGVQPGLSVASPAPNQYEKGSLIITVIDRRSGQVAWRSAMQGFAGLDIREADRRKHLNEIVTRMLAGVPARRELAP